MQQVLDFAQRQWIANVHHHCQSDDFGRRFEIANLIFHSKTLRDAIPQLKPVYSDKARASASGYLRQNVASGPSYALLAGSKNCGPVLRGQGQSRLCLSCAFCHLVGVRLTELMVFSTVPLTTMNILRPWSSYDHFTFSLIYGQRVLFIPNES